MNLWVILAFIPKLKKLKISSFQGIIFGKNGTIESTSSFSFTVKITVSWYINWLGNVKKEMRKEKWIAGKEIDVDMDKKINTYVCGAWEYCS